MSSFKRWGMLKQRSVLHCVVLLLIHALAGVASETGAMEPVVSDNFMENEFLCLLQNQARMLRGSRQARGKSRLHVTPENCTLVGRYDVAESQGDPVARFDAIGFEIQFTVQGATEVHILLEQQISGPYGWFAAPEQRGLYLRQRHPQPFHARHQVDGSPLTELMQPSGSEPHHFLVYVDGVPQRTPLQPVSACRVCTFDTADAVAGQATAYPVATGLSPHKSHSIRIVKTSEPDWCSFPDPTPNWLAFHGLALDSGTATRPTEPRPSRRIEFIGDSWMAGFCNVCNGTLATEGKWENSMMDGEPDDVMRWGSFALAWPFVACEALEAECHSTILSGVGVYCNTHGDDEDVDCSADTRLPQYWQRTLATEPASLWGDTDLWAPAAVVVGASQNDHLYSEHRSKANAIDAYEEFIRTLAVAYPEAQIIVTCGPFSHQDAVGIGGPECEVVEAAASGQAKQGVKVEFLSMNHFATETDLGQCCSHMNEEYAKVVGEYFAEWLNDKL